MIEVAVVGIAIAAQQWLHTVVAVFRKRANGKMKTLYALHLFGAYAYVLDKDAPELPLTHTCHVGKLTDGHVGMPRHDVKGM